MAPDAPATYALSEATSDDFHDYDIISDSGPRSLDSSIAEFTNFMSLTGPLREPAPSTAAKKAYETAALSPEEVQAYVQRTAKSGGAGADTKRSRSRDPAEREKTYRVYVDGIFECLHAGHLLQLRQAKLAFPSVHLLVGPFTDESCRAHGLRVSVPHLERSELVRHCRWVDEVLLDSPVVLDEAFLAKHRIDYVAVEEGSSVDPSVAKARLAGYDIVKSAGKAIPTRRTRGLIGPSLSLLPVPPPPVPANTTAEVSRPEEADPSEPPVDLFN